MSVTTRARRPSEIDGVHYHFLTADRFRELRDAGELLESAEVHGNFYGTPRAPVDALLRAGRDVLFDIDYQGAQQIRARARDDVATVFILPPSMREIARWTLYDYVLVNDDLQRTLGDVLSILAAERLRRARTEAAVAGFVERLDAETR